MSSQKLVDFIHEQLQYVHKPLLVYANLIGQFELKGRSNPFFPNDYELSHEMQESKLSVVCERVLDRCLAPSTATGEGCDNMTMVLVQFKKPIKCASSSEQSSQSKSADNELEIEGTQD